MAAITVFQRYEKKFLMDEDVMEKILPEIEAHMNPDKYCIDGATYPISNLYYDTVTNDVIRDSLQKPFYKEKLRMRCYGIPKNKDTQVFLELKKKVNKIVTKRRAKLTYGEACMFMERGIYPETDSYMTTQVLREIEYYLYHKDVYANTRISYDRLAFFDARDDSFRLTFDKNIRYLKRGDEPVDFDDRSKGVPLLPKNLRLMEVKVSNAYPMWFAKLLSTEGIHAVSFSKFGASYKKELLDQLGEKAEYATILSQL